MFEHAVKNKINLTRDDKKSDFYIAFGISKAFTYPVGVLITSILKNNKDIRLCHNKWLILTRNSV